MLHSPFTPVQKRYIRMYNKYLSRTKMAAKLKCKVWQVESYRVSAGLKKDMAAFTYEQKQFINNNYLTMTDEEIAIRFDSKKITVGNYRHVNGLKKRNKGKVVEGYFDISKMKNWAV